MKAIDHQCVSTVNEAFGLNALRDPLDIADGHVERLLAPSSAGTDQKANANAPTDCFGPPSGEMLNVVAGYRPDLCSHLLRPYAVADVRGEESHNGSATASLTRPGPSDRSTHIDAHSRQ